MPAASAIARISLVALILPGVMSCGAPSSGKEDAETTEAAAGRDTDETVFDDMLETQDRARAVEGLTLGRKDELDRALESAVDEESADAE